MNSGIFKNVTNKLFVYNSYINKHNLTLNNLQELIIHKKITNNTNTHTHTHVPSTLNVNTPSDIKRNINNLLSRAKLISSPKTIFYKEIKNQTLINNAFPNYIVDEKIIHSIRNVSQQNKHCNTQNNK